MQTATQVRQVSATYPVRSLLADIAFGVATLFALSVAAVMLGGATFYTPWFLFGVPVYFAAGYSRGQTAGNPWAKSVLLNFAPVLMVLRHAGFVTIIIAAIVPLPLLAGGIIAKRRIGDRKRLHRLANILPLVLFVAGAAAWYSYIDYTNGTVVSSGQTRRYLLHVPKSYNASRPAPLVISLHPAASSPMAEQAISRWNDLADESGFLVVYPAGRDFPQIWPMGPHSAEVDARFISDLIDKLQTTYNIDRARIYADGISTGGGMSFALSCRLADRLAAVGAISAAQSLPFSWCGQAAPVPVMTFHGTADEFVPYQGGASFDRASVFPNVRAWVGNWAQRNRCSAAQEANVAPGVRRLSYQNCAADVVLYTVDGGGHAWPGNPMPAWVVGHTSREITATRLLWEFYQQHPRSSVDLK